MMASAPAGFSVADSLSRHPYFEGIGAGSLAVLAGEATRRQFQAGEMLFLESEPSAGLWIIERGGVRVYKLNPEGREHILHLLGPGDSFNDISALDSGPNPANAAALSALTAWVIPSGSLRRILLADPALALAAVSGLTRRVRGLVQQLEDLALYAVPVRLARFLITQSEEPSLAGPGVTRAAIAAHLATTPESVSRALRALEESGAIRFDRHRIVIIDLARLRALALAGDDE